MPKTHPEKFIFYMKTGNGPRDWVLSQPYDSIEAAERASGLSYESYGRTSTYPIITPLYLTPEQYFKMRPWDTRYTTEIVDKILTANQQAAALQEQEAARSAPKGP